MGGWRHNYMSGTHTAKFLLCHYLLTLMGGGVWVGGDIITWVVLTLPSFCCATICSHWWGWGMGGWRHNYMSGTHTAKFLLCHYLLTLMGCEVWVGGDIITWVVLTLPSFCCVTICSDSDIDITLVVSDTQGNFPSFSIGFRLDNKLDNHLISITIIGPSIISRYKSLPWKYKVQIKT